MGDRVWTQCQVCGELHQVENARLSDDDLYIKLHCPCCRDRTNHLLIGKNADDVYIYGNMVLDTRYYEYNTK